MMASLSLRDENKIFLIPVFLLISFYIYVTTSNILFLFVGVILLLFPLIVIRQLQYLLGILFFLIPNQSMIVVTQGGSSFLYIYIIFLFIRVLFDKRIFFKKEFIVLEILLFIFMLIKNFLNQEGVIDYDIVRVIMNWIIIITFLYHSKKKDRNELITILSYAYILGAITAGVFGIFYSLSSSTNFFDIRFSSIYNDPNYYGVSVALAISISLVQYYKTNNYFYMLCLMFLFLLGAITLSRGYFVANIPNLFFLAFVIFKKSLKTSILFLFISSLLIFSSLEWLSDIYGRILYRFTEEELSNGRIYLWDRYLNILLENPRKMFWGMGTYDKDGYRINYGLTQVPHNIIIGGLAIKGLCITVLLIYHYFYIWKLTKLKIHINFDKTSFLVFFTLLIGYSFLDSITTNNLQYGFMLFLLFSFQGFSRRQFLQQGAGNFENPLAK